MHDSVRGHSNHWAPSKEASSGSRADPVTEKNSTRQARPRGDAKEEHAKTTRRLGRRVSVLGLRSRWVSGGSHPFAFTQFSPPSPSPSVFLPSGWPFRRFPAASFGAPQPRSGASVQNCRLVESRLLPFTCFAPPQTEETRRQFVTFASVLFSLCGNLSGGPLCSGVSGHPS